MALWLNAQLSPHLASWIAESLGIETYSVSRLGLRDASDREIYMAAKRAKATVITKDLDFVNLHEELGPPPDIIWLTLGNTSNAHMRGVLTKHLEFAMKQLSDTTSLIEIRGDSNV